MKHTLHKTLALLLCFAMLLPVSVWAAPTYGEELTDRTTQLHNGVTMHRQAHWSSYYNDLRQEIYVNYTPGGTVRPVAMFGGAVTNRTTATETAALLEQEGKRVVFGINGDFFDPNGAPTGLLVSGGKLLSSDAGNYAVGFTADGQVVIDRPRLSLLASVNHGDPFYLAAFNKARSSNGGVFAYTHEFNLSHTTGTTESGVDVILSLLSAEEAKAALEQDILLKKAASLHISVEELTSSQRTMALREVTFPEDNTAPSIGQKTWYRVERVIENTSGAATSVAPEQLVLSVNARAPQNQQDFLRAMKSGDIFSLDIPSNTLWSSVTEAVGGLDLLVENGQPKTGLGTENGPRTAVGVKANGEVILYTVDGRRGGYSIGSSLNTLAQRMAELGCVTAIRLDGGGSTTAIAARLDSDTVSILNRPSDNAERKVSNLLLLVADVKESSHPQHVYLDVDNPYVLAGSSVELRTALVGIDYSPLPVTPTLRATYGKISGTTFTAPPRGGTVTITSSAQTRYSTLDLTVVDAPDDLRLYRDGVRVTDLFVQPGESVDLSVSAFYKHLPLASADNDFTWSVSEKMGHVDENGVYTASLFSGNGTLSISKGDYTLTIPVTIANKPLLTLEDFETGSIAENGYNTTVSAVEGGDLIRFGKVSMRVDYTGLEEGGAAVSLKLRQSDGYDRLNLSVCGDGSGNTLALYDSAGASTPVTTLDFTGWKEVSVPAAAGTSFTALTIQGPTPSGTIYIDQLVASYDSIVDTAVPAITGMLENGILTASAIDEVDGKLKEKNLTLLIDGSASTAYTLSEGTLTADLTTLFSDGRSHRVTLTAQDASGNRSRMSWDIAASGAGAMPFVDCVNSDGTPHWANANIQYFYDQGLLAGYDVGGKLYARPNNNMTRAEFAVLLFRYLGLDGRDYQEADVPYADLGRIDPWAMDAAKAMYVLGIMKGSATEDGKTYFSPHSTITRAQAITMLGRLQEKGYAGVELSDFTDAANVPDWAAQHLKIMVAQGVINGSNGKLNPNSAMTRAQALKILSLMR